jgi:thiol-disulfide isomerase/thioredoxin
MSYLLPHLHSGFAVDQAILSVCRDIIAWVVTCCVSSTMHASGCPTPCDHCCCLPAACTPQEEDRVVILRFGHDWDETCMQMDEVRRPRSLPCLSLFFSSSARNHHRIHTHIHRTLFITPYVCPLQVLASVAEKIKNFGVIYLVDVGEVPDFNAMYELYDPCTIMFFFRNKVRRGGEERKKGGIEGLF